MVGSKDAGVAPPVMSLAISSSVYPTASFAATLAIGKPVAFEASAEERDTRGFISITTMRPSSGLTANCTFEPPVSTPISRSPAIEASRDDVEELLAVVGDAAAGAAEREGGPDDGGEPDLRERH